MPKANTKARTAQGLRRKAYRLYRKADAALRNRKVWDAAQLKQRAQDLEHAADQIEDEYMTGDSLAGFDDEDLAAVAATTVQVGGML